MSKEEVDRYDTRHISMEQLCTDLDEHLHPLSSRTKNHTERDSEKETLEWIVRVRILKLHGFCQPFLLQCVQTRRPQANEVDRKAVANGLWRAFNKKASYLRSVVSWTS